MCLSILSTVSLSTFSHRMWRWYKLTFFQFKKDQIILDLKKKEESSWAVQLSSSGLEQASSDESD